MPRRSIVAVIASDGVRMLMALAICCAHVAAGAAPDDKGLSLDAQGENWPGYGRTYNETRASPLSQVNADNIQRLGLAWSTELEDVHNGATVPRCRAKSTASFILMSIKAWFVPSM